MEITWFLENWHSQAVLSFHFHVYCHFSHAWIFANLWTIARQAPLSMGFCRQEYWSGLPFPPPGDLPDPGIEPVSLISPALAGTVLILEQQRFELCGSTHTRIFFFSGKYVVGPLYLWALNPWIPQTTNGKFHPWLVEFTGAESIDTEGQLWNLNVCGFLYTWEAVEPTPCGYREMRVFAVSTDFTREMALK